MRHQMHRKQNYEGKKAQLLTILLISVRSLSSLDLALLPDAEDDLRGLPRLIRASLLPLDVVEAASMTLGVPQIANTPCETWYPSFCRLMMASEIK